VWFKFANIKGAKIIMHLKSPAFKAAKLKDFTIFVTCCEGVSLNYR